MFQEGQQVGLYTLIEKIGQGGFGEVWLAENQTNSLIQKVAIKLPLHNQIDLSAIKEEVFNWTGAGKHKNILPFIEWIPFGNRIALVSEYAPDGSLQNLINKKGSLPIPEAVEIAIGILDGLTHLHNRQIIHRDLKPDNVLFQGGSPRLTDFGISRAMPQDSLSQLIAGTANYMSVESFAGTRNEKTDIFSVGVILYQALTNKLPFLYRKEIMKAVITENETLLRQYKDEIPQSLPNKIPSDLQDIIIKSLAKDPSKRYQTADEMYQELKTFETNFIQQVNTNSDDSILLQNSSIGITLVPAPTEASPTQPSPTADKEISPAEEQSTLTKIKFLQDKEGKEDAGKQSLIPAVKHNELPQFSKEVIENGDKISFATSDDEKEKRLTEEKRKLDVEFAKLFDELGELQLLGFTSRDYHPDIEDFLYISSEVGLRDLKEDIAIGKDLLHRINRLRPEANRFGISVPKMFTLDGDSVIEFEKKVSEAMQIEASNSLIDLQAKYEKSVKIENSEIEKQQGEEEKNSKRAEFLKRLNIANEKAQKIGFAYTIDQSTFDENSNKEIEEILKHFEDSIHEAEKKLPDHNYKDTLRIIFFTPIMLSGIVFVFWYFEPIRPLFPRKILGLWLIAMIIGLAVGAAKDKEIPIIIKLIGVNLIYLMGLGALFGVHYLANPNKTLKVYDDTIKILGLKRESSQQTSPLDYKYPFNRQNRIPLPLNFPNTNVNTGMNTSPNANTQVNISPSNNTQSNLQLKNSNTPIILGKTPPVISLAEQNANIKKSIDDELEKNGLKKPFNNVNVEVNILEIKLSGFVKDLNSKKQAVDIANRKKGYRSVDSDGLSIFKPIR